MGLLRFWLALAVVIGHAGPLLGYEPLDATAAVLGFYVLSGLMMAMVLDTRYAHDLPAFYWNRFLRIWPPYLAVLGATLALMLGAQILLGWAFGPLYTMLFQRVHPSLATLGLSLLGQVTLLGPGWSHFFAVTPGGGLAFAPNSYFQPNSLWHFDLLPQAWTLTTEVAFYLLAPAVVHWRSRTLAAWFLAGLAVRLGLELWLLPQQAPWHSRFLPLDLTVFCGGIVAWRAVRHGLPPRLHAWRGALAALAAAYFMSAHYLLLGSVAWQHLATPLMTCAAVPWLMQVLKSRPWEQTLGALSYPLYVGHALVVELTTYYPTDHILFYSARVVLASLATAYLIHLFLERPLERFKRVPKSV